MAQLASSNTDNVTSSDRQAPTGAQPDNTPVGPSGGSPTPPGGGNVVWLGGASTAGDLVQFADTTGKVIADGGLRSTSFDPAGAAAAAQADAIAAAAAYALSLITGGFVPTGGSTNQRLKKHTGANFDTNWGSDQWIYAQDYGVVADGTTDDTAALNNAIAAAASVHGTVLLPPGVMKVSGTVGGSFTGYIGMKGMGANVSVIRQDAASNAVYFDLSGGTRTSNCANLSGFTVRCNSAGAGSGVAIDYGTTTQSSVSTVMESTIYDVTVDTASGAFSNCFFLRNIWAARFDRLFSFGSIGGGGAAPTSGNGINVTTAINCTFSNIYHAFLNHGFEFNLAYTGGGSQGILIENYVGVEVNSFIYGNASFGDGFGALVITNFLWDNGNLASANHQSMFLNNNGSLQLSNGQILQNGPGGSLNPMILLENCDESQISNVNVASSSVSAQIQFATGCTNGLVTGCILGKSSAPPIQCDSGSSNIKASANNYASAAANVDNGTSNNIAQTNGF